MPEADGRQAYRGLFGQADTNERHVSLLITHQDMGNLNIRPKFESKTSPSPLADVFPSLREVNVL
jgi:hypothetical protein